MSHKTMRVWICDRCKVEVTTSTTVDHVNGWNRALTFDLCGECSAGFMQWMAEAAA